MNLYELKDDQKKDRKTERQKTERQKGDMTRREIEEWQKDRMIARQKVRVVQIDW